MNTSKKILLFLSLSLCIFSNFAFVIADEVGEVITDTEVVSELQESLESIPNVLDVVLTDDTTDVENIEQTIDLEVEDVVSEVSSKPADPQSELVVSTKTVSLHIRNGDEIVFDGNVSVTPNESILITDNANSTHSISSDSVLAVLKTADDVSTAFNLSDLAYYESYDSFLVNCIEIVGVTTENKCYNWQFVVDDTYPNVGMNSYTVNDASDVYIYFGNQKRLTLENDIVIENGLFYVKVEKYSYTDNSWEPLPNTEIGIVYPDPNDEWSNIIVSKSVSDVRGMVLFTAPKNGSYNIGVSSEYYYPNIPVIVEDTNDRITTLLKVRNGDDIIIDKVFVLQNENDTEVSDSYNNNATIKTNSVLNLLKTADSGLPEFDLTDIRYYTDYNSFLINCIKVNGNEDGLCYNWQYVVNNTYPFVGTNSYNLNNNDKVYLYFGNQKRLIVPSKVKINEEFSISAEKYNYEDNTWQPLTDVVIGETVPNINDPYNPVELATSTVSNLGIATFSINAIGTYNFGLKDDFYYPLYPVNVSIDGGNGSGGSTTNSGPNLEKMIDFLDINQSNDGSFGSDLYSDWAAIAYGSISGHTQSKNLLKEFLKKDYLGNNSSVTDFERRAMALMALNINPYTGGTENYISKIIESFDGNQFGEEDLFNDDIFAIITLRRAGYSESDNEIIKARDYIIKSIRESNNFDSPDIAAATIQALDIAEESPDSIEIINLAKNYIISNQNSDGGFGGDSSNSSNSSTSWILGSLGIINLDSIGLINNGRNPIDYIASIQALDGGIEDLSTGDIKSRIWATSYAIVGIQGKTWNQILKPFPKGSMDQNNSNNNIDDVTNPNNNSENVLTTAENIIDQQVIADSIVAKDALQNIKFSEYDGDQNVQNNQSEIIETSNLAFVGSRMGYIQTLLGSIAILIGGFILIRKWI